MVPRGGAGIEHWSYSMRPQYASLVVGSDRKVRLNCRKKLHTMSHSRPAAPPERSRKQIKALSRQRTNELVAAQQHRANARPQKKEERKGKKKKKMPRCQPIRIYSGGAKWKQMAAGSDADAPDTCRVCCPSTSSCPSWSRCAANALAIDPAVGAPPCLLPSASLQKIGCLPLRRKRD